MPPVKDTPLDSRHRIIALFIGTGLILALSKLYASILGVSILWASVWVVAGAIAIMVSLAALCEKYFLGTGDRRVQLSTLLLLFVPFAVYFTAVHFFFKLTGRPSSIEEWLFTAFGLAVAITLITTILLYYGEALAWLVFSVARWCGYLPPLLKIKKGDAAKAIRCDVSKALVAKIGHYRYESGHHGDLWLDLELLCQRPAVIEPFAAELAAQLEKHRVEIVCGPLVEGAFVAMMVAGKLDAEFVYTERIEHAEKCGLFPVEYRIPQALRSQVRGKRVAIVNDVINAGSAVRGTAASLRESGAAVVAVASLATIGSTAMRLADEYRVPLYKLATLEARVWPPEDCQLCRDGVPLKGVAKISGNPTAEK